MMHTLFPFKDHKHWIVASWNDDNTVFGLRSYKSIIRAIVTYQKTVKKGMQK